MSRQSRMPVGVAGDGSIPAPTRLGPWLSSLSCLVPSGSNWERVSICAMELESRQRMEKRIDLTMGAGLKIEGFSGANVQIHTP